MWEAAQTIPGILPVLAVLAGTLVATTLSLLLVLNRARLLESIKQTELELKRTRDGARRDDGRVEKLPDTLIVTVHDRLVQYRQDLRRTREHAKLSLFLLLPLLAGSLLGIGYALGALRDLEQGGQTTAEFRQLEQALEQALVKGRTLEEETRAQATVNAAIARQVEGYAQERQRLEGRLQKTEQRLARERQERIELEVLVGRAEQRLAALEVSHAQEMLNPHAFPSVDETEPHKTQGAQQQVAEAGPKLDVQQEPSVEESDLTPDDPGRSTVDGTSLYRGMLSGQIAFDRAQRQAWARATRPRIYVLVRWGESDWIVTGGQASVSATGAVEGAFTVILPVTTIRALDVTAIATDRVYRRYQHVRLPAQEARASTATVTVQRS